MIRHYIFCIFLVLISISNSLNVYCQGVVTRNDKSKISSGYETESGADSEYGFFSAGKVVIDKTSGLMWTYDDYISANNNPLKNSSWDEAVKWKDYLNEIKYGGYSDWRLPTVKELLTIYRPKNRRDISKKYFAPTTAYALWSSNSPGKGLRSYVGPNDGFATSGWFEGQQFAFSVRLVRTIN